MKKAKLNIRSGLPGQMASGRNTKVTVTTEDGQEFELAGVLELAVHILPLELVQISGRMLAAEVDIEGIEVAISDQSGAPQVGDDQRYYAEDEDPADA